MWYGCKYKYETTLIDNSTIRGDGQSVQVSDYIKEDGKKVSMLMWSKYKLLIIIS